MFFQCFFHVPQLHVSLEVPLTFLIFIAIPVSESHFAAVAHDSFAACHALNQTYL